MQKLLRRSRTAERQVARRTKRAQDQEFAQKFRDRRSETTQALQNIHEDLSAARKARHEKWEKGPLAPKFDMLPDYGVVKSPARLNQSEFVRPFEAEARCAWAGGVKFLNLAVGDRVVFVDGPMKGKLDEIEEISPDLGTVKLKEYKVRARAPDFMRKVYKNEAGFSEVMEVGPSIPISAIRLVHPVTDPETGVTRDMLVKQIHFANVRRDKLTGTTEWDRIIPGSNVILPWPEKARPEHKQHACDTGRGLVHEKTFVPTLLNEPMPPRVLDELRGAYSRFRTRHEDWYIAKKEAEEAAKKNRPTPDNSHLVLPSSMRTPIQEFNQKVRELRRARGPPQLSDDMLEKLGQLMARKAAEKQQ